MKFKTKGSYIEAEQFDQQKKWPADVECLAGTNKPFLKTPKGNINLTHLDWLVRLPSETVVVPNKAFSALFEKVEG